MNKPVIGIVAKYFKLEEFYNWSWNRISNSLRYALCKNGANVIGILPQSKGLNFQEVDEHDETKISDEEQQDLIKFVSMCDGIVLQGGVNSAYYEEFIAKYCYDNNIPTLGICAGYNTMIRALGGTTKKLENNRHDRPDLQYAHKCQLTQKTSKFYSIIQKDEINVNSIHSYIADKVPRNLTIVAKSDDDQVEVIEAKNKKFYIGCKYHPELMVDTDKCQNDIFKYFINLCKKNNLVTI